MDMKSDPYARAFNLFTSHIGDYMRRYIFKHPWGTIRLHHILRSDVDRHLHDHPFDFTSILLTGGYWEVRDRSDDWHGLVKIDGSYPPLVALHWWSRWSIVRRQSTDLHRLILEKREPNVDHPVWTLVFTGKKLRSWGFQTENGWVRHTDYFKEGRGKFFTDDNDEHEGAIGDEEYGP